ncbi:TonB-dependent receptor [Alteromonas sp. a30]|uniref:TonB-dependent receptor n=1 Tax=Alteromonas sp. a30 TaxID=2730917 RepID=UPI0022809F4B|nr:TonB-dependent receptor [Alteromonas sp. a30]
MPFSILTQAQESQQNITSLETIVVSASKLESTISSTTSNISFLTDEDIKRISPTHINESLKRIPGVWISRGNGQEHLTAIRSPVLTGAGSCGAFFMAEDGISLRAPGFCNANQLFAANTEQAGRIEVLRGPHSSVFGANALHGVLNILTPDVANMDKLSWQLDAGGYGYLRGRFSATYAQNEQAFAVYGHANKDEGFKDNSGFDQQKLNFLHQFSGQELSVKNHLSLTNLNQETAGFIEGFKAYEEQAFKRTNPNPEAYRDAQSVRAYSRWLLSLGEDTSLLVTPYARYNNMTFLMHFVPWQPVETNGHRSLGIQSQYQRDFANVQLALGVDVDWSEGWLSEVQDAPFTPNLPAGVHYDYQVDALNYSSYLNINWLLTAPLKLEMGLRYDVMEYDYETFVPAGSACEPNVSNCRFTRPESQRNQFNDLSYKIGANYELTSQQHLYMQYAQGFRPPQAAELYRLQAGQSIANLDSEEIQSFEVGFRGQSGYVFYDVTWFDMNKENYIFQDTQRRNIDNGETRHQGVEIRARANLGDWYLGASATFAEHEYANDIQISRSGSILGNEIDTAPDTLANIQLGWKKDGHFWELEWSKMGDYYLDPENTASYDGHELVNFRTGWQLTEQWQLSVRLLNLLDEDYAERADLSFGNYRYFVGEPRAIYFSLGFRQ